MYSGEKAVSLPATETQQNGPISEAGPAVEVIELANGETIWYVTSSYAQLGFSDCI
jgi:hypothetical protein